jgi:hypothetical protein
MTLASQDQKSNTIMVQQLGRYIRADMAFVAKYGGTRC